MTTIVDLKSMRSRPMNGDSAVVSTCGAIFWKTKSTRDHSDTRDLIAGEDIVAPPYSWFRCSSDRKVVVGIPERSRDLYKGVPPELKIAEGSYLVNISPDGNSVAYFRNLKPLCAFIGSGPIECANESAVIPDEPSVKNSGEVLVTVDTPGGCYYRSMTDFSPAPVGRANDECIGIGYWKPGMKKIQPIEPLGRAPQWIDPVTARLLRAWAASHLN